MIIALESEMKEPIAVTEADEIEQTGSFASAEDIFKEIVKQTNHNLQPTSWRPISNDDLGYEFEGQVLDLLKNMLLAHAQKDVYDNVSNPHDDKKFVQDDLIALSTILAGPGNHTPVP